MSVLPTQKITKKTDNPKNLILFGLPKCGKSTVVSKLPHSLTVDLENGTDYLEDCFAVKATNYKELWKIARALSPVWKGKENPHYEEHNYQFIIIDTVTALEEMANEYAIKLYQDTPQGKNYQGDNILTLPMGAGYYFVRLAVQNMISWFDNAAPNIILLGHVKDKNLSEGGTELNVKNLDLGGKLSNILSANSDGIGYLYRNPDTGSLMANFGDMNSVLCGSRVPHLAGKTIELAERVVKDNGDYDIIAHWSRIYPSLANEEENKK